MSSSAAYTASQGVGGLRRSGASRPRDIAAPLVSVGHAWVWLFAFSSFFVLLEPAPYELIGVAVISVAFVFGLTFPRAVLPLIGLLLIYVIGGFIGVTIAPDVAEARFQILVTAFLAATSMFFACYTAKDTIARVTRIRQAWQLGAVMAAVCGIIGYFGVAGTGELFTLFGRAKGTFKDPNVFAPYLTGAVVFAGYTILSQPMNRWFGAVLVFSVCTAGIFLSFSRGAWGYTFYALAVMTTLHFVLTSHPGERLRIVLLSLAGIALLISSVLLAISVPAISGLLVERASLLQSYDAGEFGRFGRQLFGLQLALENPLGLGAFGFREVYSEDPHNVYLNALLTHGWMGFFAYTVLVVVTALKLLQVVLYHPGLRAVAVPLFALFTGLMLMGGIIDTDRWRQFFLLLGLGWGVIAAAIAAPGSVGHSGAMKRSTDHSG